MDVLVQIDGYDPVAAAAVTLRAASIDDARVCLLDGQTWWPALARLPRLRYDLFDGGFGGAIETPGSSLTLATEPWPLIARYTLADARLRLWVGQAGDSWPSWTLRFDGRVTAQPTIADGLAELDFAVDDRWLDAPLLTTYAGTGGAEGPAGLKGAVKPLALGAPRYVGGILVDSASTVFQLSAFGAIEDVEAALERLLRFGVSAGDHVSYAALIAATIPAGRWATSKAAGLVRFGAPLVGKQSFLVKGDKAGPDGWARKPGQLIRRLALLSGGAGRIDEASLNALDLARPYNLSLYLDEQASAREMIQRLAASVNAVAGVSWLGKLFVAPVAIGAPVATLAADGSALPPVAAVEQIAAGAPWWRLALEAERAWAVHELSDVAFTAQLVNTGDYEAGKTYREGNIVQDQASSWLYINPTPTAGNAPPTLPATANAFWKILASAGAGGTDGLDGVDGDNGQAIDSIYLRAATQPATPAPSAGVPAGWGATVATAPGTGVMWVSVGRQPGGIGNFTWETPLRQEGVDGEDGSPGISAFSVSPPSKSFSIATSAAGTPNVGEFNKVVTFLVRQGVTDISDDPATTYSEESSPLGAINASMGGTNNKVYTATGMTAAAGKSVVTIQRSGVTIGIVEIDFIKAPAGSSATQGRDETLDPMPNSTAFVLLGTFALAVPNGLTLDITATVQWLAATGTYPGQIQASYQEVDAGAETFSSAVGGDITATTSEQAVAVLSGFSFTNSAGLSKTYRIRLYGRRTGGTGASSGTSGYVEAAGS